jgi:hypothetical protein
MGMLSRLFIHALFIVTASAGTVHVVVGNTGCNTKQLTVQRLWKSMPGVRSVVIVPRGPDAPANQRVFIVTTDGADPDQAALSRALGRRAERYPILSLTPSPPATRRTPPLAPATSP